jgi:hypothetical protein
MDSFSLAIDDCLPSFLGNRTSEKFGSECSCGSCWEGLNFRAPRHPVALKNPPSTNFPHRMPAPEQLSSMVVKMSGLLFSDQGNFQQIPSLGHACQPRFTIKHHLLRYACPSSLRRTCLYASLLGTAQALHLMLAGEPGDVLTNGFHGTMRNLMVDLGQPRNRASQAEGLGLRECPHS